MEVNTPPTVSPEAWRPPLPTNTGDLEPDPQDPTLDRPKSAPRGVCQGVRASMYREQPYPKSINKAKVVNKQHIAQFWSGSSDLTSPAW